MTNPLTPPVPETVASPTASGAEPPKTTGAEAAKPINPVPWVSRLSLRLTPALDRKLTEAARLAGLAQDEAAAKLLDAMESASLVFGPFGQPADDTPQPPRPLRRRLKVAVSRQVLHRLRESSAKSGFRTEQIAVEFLEQVTFASLTPCLKSMNRLHLEMQVNKDKPLKLQNPPALTKPATQN